MKLEFLIRFFQIRNFGSLVWSLRVALELSNIGESERIIGSPPNSNDVVIGPLLSSGGRKTSLSSG